MILPALHPAQIQVQTDRARFKVIAAGRRWGKGVLGLGESVLRASTGKRVWWIAPSFASAAYQAGWRMLEFYSSKLAGSNLHLQRRMLSLPGGGFVQFKTAEEADSLRGESVDFAVIDEAAHIRDLQGIWELCLRPCLVDTRGDAWFISTPNGHNYFHDLFQRGIQHSPGWASFQFASSSNPFLDQGELEEIGRDMPVMVRRQEIDAEFVQLAGALFKREAIRILEALPAVSRWVRCWDLAFTTKTTSDFTVGVKAGLPRTGQSLWPTLCEVGSSGRKLFGLLRRRPCWTAQPSAKALRQSAPKSARCKRSWRILPSLAWCSRRSPFTPTRPPGPCPWSPGLSRASWPSCVLDGIRISLTSSVASRRRATMTRLTRLSAACSMLAASTAGCFTSENIKGVTLGGQHRSLPAPRVFTPRFAQGQYDSFWTSRFGREKTPEERGIPVIGPTDRTNV